MVPPRFRRGVPSAVRRAAVMALAAFAPFVAPASAQPAAQSPLTFAEAQQQVRASHQALAGADREVAQRSEERRAQRALYWPTVDLNARATRIDDPITIDLDPIRQVILGLHRTVPPALVPPFTLDVQDSFFWRADVRVTWPIYTGGKVGAANRAAEAQVHDAEAGRRQVSDSLSTDLVRRYFAARLASRALAVRSAVLEGLDRHLRDATRLEEEGLISRAERLHAEVARAEADRQLRRAGHDVELARAALSNILSTEEVAEPVTPLFLLTNVAPLADFQAEAIASNPAFARLTAQQGLARAGLDAERGRLRPDVFLFGMKELHTADLTLLDPSWAVGVGATFKLFDGFERSHRIGAARLRQQRVDLAEARARRDVETLVEKRYIEMTTAAEQFDALKASLALADESLRVRTRAFEEGMGTSLEVVDARLAMSRVQLERLVAAYQFDVALAELLEACGRSDRFDQLRARGVGVENPD